MLVVENVDVNYGAIRALVDVSLEVHEGEIVALIGANGAGKSTTLRSISGLVKPNKGRILFEGSELQKCPPHKVVEMGISQVPEGRRVFPLMTVLENLEMGAFTRKDRANIKDDIDKVFAKFPRLEERKKQPAGTLSGGEQQMLAIGRALMSKPKIMLMDEPSMGLAPMLVQEIFNIVKEINQSGTTILLVEQNARMALAVANRGYVLETGQVVISGAAADLAKNEAVQKAYLGV
ncbi:MAG TPA: ABC transporter ATP-binding protein [Desulfotomaculum sp.]|nr:MAG: amino acid ABC transporter ATPase [Peptococcaceae bacterium BRH_c8a]KJS77758.1 MAG: amino acid ABC transporter ATPase [Desulfotomaculum sp. BICA1-6]HBX22766.1 ABC transporter ATP-binding protein [Desulfotomaculum sp.]